MGGFQTIFSIRHCKLLGNLWFFILFLILQIFIFGLNLVWFKELSHRVWQRKSKKIAFLLSFFAIFKFFKLFTRGPSSYCFAVGRGGVANLNLISLLSQIFFAISFFLQYVEFQFFFTGMQSGMAVYAKGTKFTIFSRNIFVLLWMSCFCFV